MKFEYKVIKANYSIDSVESVIKSYATDNWRLVSAFPYHVYDTGNCSIMLIFEREQ